VKDPRITSLISEVAKGRKAELLEQMMETIMRFGRDGTSVADLKLYNRAIGEMRYASSIFSRYSAVRKIAIFGSARTGPESEEYLLARNFAHIMVEEGYMVITGGGDGIMGAAQMGAGADKSFGLNIQLPFEQQANETIHGDPKLLDFRYFFTRKLHFVKDTHAFALFPGGFGTHDEGLEVLTLLQTGKSSLAPVLFIDTPGGHYWDDWMEFVKSNLLANGLISDTDLYLFRVTHGLEEAKDEILRFYSNFHSYRWVRERMVIRIQRRLTKAALEKLNQDFVDLLAADQIVQREALREEATEKALAHFPRIVLTPHRKDFGTIRRLIDTINAAETESH
jgi:uncharacterized protein (TIGR00730 family)